MRCLLMIEDRILVELFIITNNQNHPCMAEALHRASCLYKTIEASTKVKQLLIRSIILSLIL